MRRPLGPCVGLFLIGCDGVPEPPRAPMAPLAIPPMPPSGPDSSLPPASPAESAPPAEPSLQSPGPPAAVALSVEAFYQGQIPFECDFAVDAFDKRRNVHTTWQTHVVFVRPGELVATLSSGSVVIAHAATLAAYDPVARQWLSATVSPDFVPAALCYAGGPGSLTNHLSFVGYPGSAMNAPGLDLLVGSPLRGAPNLTKLLLFTGPSGEVVRTLAVSLQNDRERWSATRCAYSIAAPPPSLFPSVPVTPNAHSLSSARRAFLEEIASLTTAIP